MESYLDVYVVKTTVHQGQKQYLIDFFLNAKYSNTVIQYRKYCKGNSVGEVGVLCFLALT